MRAVTIYRATVAALSLLAAAACSPDFEKIWDVTDLRILAVQASPPEVLFISVPATFPTVRVTALVADPRAPKARVDWEMWACTPEKKTCDDAHLREKVAAGSGAQGEIATNFVLSRALYDAGMQKDTFRGFGGLPIKVEVRVKRGTYQARAIKRVIYGFALPPGKWPNNNPSITEVQVDDETMPAAWEVEADEEYELLPKTPTWDRETYTVLTFSGVSQACLKDPTAAGCSRTLEENLTYSYFATSGEISHASTGGKDRAFVTDKKVKDISSTWTPESDVDEATLWVVVRDDRGGTAWSTLKAKVKEPKKK